MTPTGIDHIVLVVRDIDTSLAFYREVLGMTPREERPGKWSLDFGGGKISVQKAGKEPKIAANCTPGSANFCLLTGGDIDAFAQDLRDRGIELLTGPSVKDGAAGPINSVHFRDPDGNLVEVGALV